MIGIRVRNFMLYMLGAVVVYLALTLFASAAHAQAAAPAPAPVAPGLPWEAWFALAIAALGSIRGLVRGATEFVGFISRQTKTTTDDALYRKMDHVADTLDDIAARLPGGGGTSLHVAKRDPQAGRTLTGVLFALAMAGLMSIAVLASSCATVKAVPPAAKTAVVECGKADARQILALLAELGTQAALSALGQGAIDWAGIEASAIARGKVVGGCALTRFVAELSKAPKADAEVAGLLAPPDPAADGRAALARLSVAFDGATYEL